jgi:hypothetical protein
LLPFRRVYDATGSRHIQINVTPCNSGGTGSSVRSSHDTVS